MKILNIIKSGCVKCKSCVKACLTHLFSIKNIGNDTIVEFDDPHGFCIGCGHCVAACNYNAINYEDPKTHIKMEKDDSADYSSVINLLKGQRSIRNYLSKEVPKEDINKIIDIMRYAPTGSNRQSCEFIVINNDDIKDKLRQFTIKNLRKLLKLISIRKIVKPFMPKNVYKIIDQPHIRLGLKDLFDRYNQGEDPILFNAPYLILATGPNMVHSSYFDPTIAITYGRTAAHSLGLGSCWIGLTMDAIRNNKEVKKLLGIDKDRIIAGVMTLGYPAVKYHNIPPRNPASVKYYE